jgi:hypothetical protein
MSNATAPSATPAATTNMCIDSENGCTETTEMTEITSHQCHVTPPDKYFAGLIDAQLAVSTTKNNSARATLVSQDPRIAEQISIKFRPTRITIIKRPSKPDQCTILFTGDNMMSLLKFAVEHCVMKRDLAKKTLDFMDNKATTVDIKSVDMNTDMSPIDLDWAGGYFDVRGSVTQHVPATEGTKRKRGSVKMVFPKHERFAIPALQRVVQGRVKKNSPCRLVFETKDAIKEFLNTVDGHVWAKKSDLCQLSV